MATLNPVISVRPEGNKTITWTNILANSSITSASVGGYPHKIVQISGTFGTNVNVSIAGSNNDVDFANVKDLQNNAFTVSDTSLYSIQESTLYYKPILSAANVSTQLTVVINCEK